MMKPFLSIVVDDLFQKLGDSIQNLTLVLPNRRASIFFNQYLSQITNKPIWQPKITTVSELMGVASGLKPADPLLLCYLLFEQYKSATGNIESFDEFFPWGNIMITDFDQTDKYLIDNSKLFANVNDLKLIEQQFDELEDEHRAALRNFLNVMDSNIDSRIRSRYSQIWSQLGNIYSQFTASLTEQGIAYEGLIYRAAANKLQNTHKPLFEGEYAIVGFNALNRCEEVLFRHLKTYSNALFYWDYDSYYMQGEHSKNEAATFITHNLKQFPNQLGSEHFNNLKNINNIHLIASPSNIAQAKLVPRILQQISPKTDKIETAVVLPDELLLLPVLSALPDHTQHLNITLGYPIRDTSAYSLVDHIFGLQSNVKSSNGVNKFYHKDVLNILKHPYIRQVAPQTDKIASDIINHKLITVDEQMFETDELLSQIFTATQTTHLPHYLNGIIAQIASLISHDTASGESNRLDMEFLLTMHRALNRLGDTIPAIKVDFSVKTLRTLFRKAMNEQRVSFVGEPLEGLQILGFLETRNLDFENVVILSMNDSILPGDTHQPSFIMPSLRFAFGLPDHRHKNAMYAYYFYRLIQRASNIYLVFSNVTEGTRTGEMSRYILQLIMESPIRVNRIDAKFKMGQTAEPEITIQKTEQILNSLHKYAGSNGKYLSPTALTAYKSCKLRFFFSKIAGIEEPEDMDETIDYRGIGTILHKAIELIYSSTNGEITTEKVEQLKGNSKLIDDCISRAFADCYDVDADRIDEAMTGRNKLIIERVRWMVKRILEVDKQRTPYTIVLQENEIKTQISITAGGNTFSVNVGGKVDRIEKCGSMYRIVDFKTAKFENSKMKFKNISDVFENNKLEGVFQLLTYSEIFAKSNGVEADNIVQNLWFARSDELPIINQKGEARDSSIEVTSYQPYRDDFSELLTQLIADLFDPQTTFDQTTDTERCRHCTYKGICGR